MHDKCFGKSTISLRADTWQGTRYRWESLCRAHSRSDASIRWRGKCQPHEPWRQPLAHPTCTHLQSVCVLAPYQEAAHHKDRRESDEYWINFEQRTLFWNLRTKQWDIKWASRHFAENLTLRFTKNCAIEYRSQQKSWCEVNGNAEKPNILVHKHATDFSSECECERKVECQLLHILVPATLSRTKAHELGWCATSSPSLGNTRSGVLLTRISTPIIKCAHKIWTPRASSYRKISWSLHHSDCMTSSSFNFRQNMAQMIFWWVVQVLCALLKCSQEVLRSVLSALKQPVSKSCYGNLCLQISQHLLCY